MKLTKEERKNRDKEINKIVTERALLKGKIYEVISIRLIFMI